jgi:hypothetical protein
MGCEHLGISGYHGNPWQHGTLRRTGRNGIQVILGIMRKLGSLGTPGGLGTMGSRGILGGMGTWAAWKHKQNVNMKSIFISTK